MIHETDTTHYEFPPDGITLLGYIVRRMHKTQWLMSVPVLVASNHTEEALAHVAMYAVTSSTTFGKSCYQPHINAAGEEVSEPDPDTGAVVRAKLLSSSPTYKISYTVTLPHGSSFIGNEEITGTKPSLRGLGMPTNFIFHFQSEDYSAELAGVITLELAYPLLTRPSICAYGFLEFQDNTGNTGKLNIDRDNNIELLINEKAWCVTSHFEVQRLES